MNKSAIKNFAVRARNNLIEDITQKAYELGITKDEIKDTETFEGGFKIKGIENGKIYKKYEIKQREKLVSNIKAKGFEQVIEEVAYTWFNRFIALRFMEVNDYLPTGVRVLSSIEEGKTEPDIIKEALNIDLDINREIVYRLIDENDTEDLYKYVLIKQCNQLGQIMPMVFEEISDYTELLLPDNLLAEGSVIRDLVESIDEEDYKDQVEIIGWLYQYYISEKKDEVFADLKKNKKITKENIPAATQLFTPKWIVKYMVENSLGRLWLESHPDEELQAKWKYYLEEAEQDPEVQKKLDELKDPNLNPEDIKVLDPAMGSGHILVYAFDVLYDIYLKANYSERDIPKLILEKNLYGLDIDDRAGQLASFALMMKARSKNRRIFRRKIELNLCSIQESNGIPKEAIEYFCRGDLWSPETTKDVKCLIEVFHDAKEYGSILDVKNIDFDTIERRLEEIRNGDTIDLFQLQYREVILENLPPLVKQGRIMSDKYDVVCTNPPYMGSGGMNKRLKKYINKNYKDACKDLSTVFMECSIAFLKSDGLLSMINIPTWMFLFSYRNIRKKIINKNTIINLLHLGRGVFGSDFGTVAFIINKRQITQYKGYYKRFFIEHVKVDSLEEKRNKFFTDSGIYFTKQEKFGKIIGVPIAYWINESYINVFETNKKLKDYAILFEGLKTRDNGRFLRLWHEVEYDKFCNWKPYSKGGEFRRWYGNNNYIIKWHDDGKDIKAFKKSSGANFMNYFEDTVTWSSVTSYKFSTRYIESSIFGGGGSGIVGFQNVDFKYILGLLNTNVVNEILNIFGTALNYEVGIVGEIPIVINQECEKRVKSIVEKNIEISRQDWDSFETSWDFKIHPLLNKEFNFMYLDLTTGLPNKTIKSAYEIWEYFSESQFAKLKANEEELNRIFIDIYGLQDELTPEVEDKDITISKADRERDIKSFISYAVGCMFGRYSLDEEGLIYAGGEFDINKYKTFIPTKDNVLVIADDDYFEDDIVNRFVEFVKVTFGEETLEENLDYISETLGNKANETSRQTIRRYFLKDFYNDHVKTYKKRPIYWLFDSGKQNGFKALIYMHRYDVSTVARVRTDYLHKLQKKYEAEVKRLDILINSDLSAREKATAKKKKDSVGKQILECIAYDQVIAHVANQKIEIDLDDGVVVNYGKFQGVQIPQGEGKKPLKADLLAKI